jgi:hypothetical protein
MVNPQVWVQTELRGHIPASLINTVYHTEPGGIPPSHAKWLIPSEQKGNRLCGRQQLHLPELSFSPTRGRPHNQGPSTMLSRRLDWL